MCDDTRYFRVEGKVYVDREDVIDWLNEDRPTRPRFLLWLWYSEGTCRRLRS